MRNRITCGCPTIDDSVYESKKNDYYGIPVYKPLLKGECGFVNTGCTMNNISTLYAFSGGLNIGVEARQRLVD
jgi:hypothetical protein